MKDRKISNEQAIRPSPDLDMPRGRRNCYLALIAAIIILCWILPIRNSLWVDETGTCWIVQDVIRQVFERAYYWSNFSPYFLTARLGV